MCRLTPARRNLVTNKHKGKYPWSVLTIRWTVTDSPRTNLAKALPDTRKLNDTGTPPAELNQRNSMALLVCCSARRLLISDFGSSQRSFRRIFLPLSHWDFALRLPRSSNTKPVSRTCPIGCIAAKNGLHTECTVPKQCTQKAGRRTNSEPRLQSIGACVNFDSSSDS